MNTQAVAAAKIIRENEDARQCQEAGDAFVALFGCHADIGRINVAKNKPGVDGSHFLVTFAGVQFVFSLGKSIGVSAAWLASDNVKVNGDFGAYAMRTPLQFADALDRAAKNARCN
jgi:hypothetical protein